MDCFSSREDAPEWELEHFEAGRNARLAELGQDSAPAAADIGERGRESWIAGWHDAEMGILADTDAALRDGSIVNPDDEIVVTMSRIADQE